MMPTSNALPFLAGRLPMNARLAALLLLVASAPLVAPAQAAPCVGFTDLDSTSAFCRNVEWIKNRKVTVGCGSGHYCPIDPVTRQQMAAFMNRLGTALTPLVARTELVSGAVDLDLAPVVCPTPDQPIADYPRRVLVDATFAATAATGVDISVRSVVSTNGGGSWQPIGTVQNLTYVPAAQWGQVTDVAILDLDVPLTVRFGVQVARVGGGSVDLSDSRCSVRTQIISRDGTTSPL